MNHRKPPHGRRARHPKPDPPATIEELHALSISADYRTYIAKAREAERRRRDEMDRPLAVEVMKVVKFILRGE